MADSPHHDSAAAAQRSRRLLMVVVGICILVNVIILAIALTNKSNTPFRPNAAQTTETTNVGALLEEERNVFAKYAGSPSCEGCHQEEFALWKISNHALAERRPSA